MNTKTIKKYHYKDGTYIASVKNDMQEIMRLIELGRKIKWSPNERWCTIGGRTFNMCKEVFEKLSKEEVRM